MGIAEGSGDAPDAPTASVHIGVVFAMDQSSAFDLLISELGTALACNGIRFEPGAMGRVLEGKTEVGHVKEWTPPTRILLEWHQADWAPDQVTEVELRLEPVGGATRLTLEHRGWGALLGGADEIAGWFASEVAAPLLRATAPTALGDWITDRRARRPSGAKARDTYRDPIYHYPNFRVILMDLALTPQDFLIEVGCGGGALLKDALKSGCHAAAVDHSAEMVQLSQQENREAVDSGRLDVRQASAENLPFPDATFSSAIMTSVFGFLPDPVRALREIHRVLRRGGRLIALGTDPEMRGTPAAPEPIASRLHFYEESDLLRLALAAGFEDARVERRNLEPFARQAGIPPEHLFLFAGRGPQFLFARKG